MSRKVATVCHENCPPPLYLVHKATYLSNYTLDHIYIIVWGVVHHLVPFKAMFGHSDPRPSPKMWRIVRFSAQISPSDPPASLFPCYLTVYPVFYVGRPRSHQYMLLKLLWVVYYSHGRVKMGQVDTFRDSRRVTVGEKPIPALTTKIFVRPKFFLFNMLDMYIVWNPDNFFWSLLTYFSSQSHWSIFVTYENGGKNGVFLENFLPRPHLGNSYFTIRCAYHTHNL